MAASPAVARRRATGALPAGPLRTGDLLGPTSDLTSGGARTYCVHTVSVQRIHQVTAEPLRIPAHRRVAKTARLDLRVSPEQKHLFEEAAAVTSRTVTEFVIQSASVAAHDVMADRTRFVLPPEQWSAFAAAIERKPRVLPRLAAFLAEPSVLERG